MMGYQESLNYRLMVAVGNHFNQDPDLAWDAMASVFNWYITDLELQTKQTIAEIEEDPETVEGAYSALVQGRWDDGGLSPASLLTKAAKEIGI